MQVVEEPQQPVQQVQQEEIQSIIDTEEEDQESNSVIEQDGEDQEMSEQISEVKVYHRQIPLELELPMNQEILLVNQKCLDTAINMAISRQQTATFSTLKPFVEGQSQRTFQMKHIQQILSVVPWMYNHKWEMRQGKPDLVLSFPENIEQLVNREISIAVPSSL